VHRVIDVGDVLDWGSDVVAQDWFTDVANFAKVVIFRPNIELDVYLRTDRPPLINDARTAWRQRRPANIIAAGSPGNPCRAPVQIVSGKPSPPIVCEIRPATVMISGPAKILVRDPSPSVVGVSPITVRVRTPILVIHRYVRLPAVSVTFNVNPVAAGKIIVKIIN